MIALAFPGIYMIINIMQLFSEDATRVMWYAGVIGAAVFWLLVNELDVAIETDKGTFPWLAQGWIWMPLISALFAGVCGAYVSAVASGNLGEQHCTGFDKPPFEYAQQWKCLGLCMHAVPQAPRECFYVR
jgi:hypothetical protein